MWRRRQRARCRQTKTDPPMVAGPTDLHMPLLRGRRMVGWTDPSHRRIRSPQSGLTNVVSSVQMCCRRVLGMNGTSLVESSTPLVRPGFHHSPRSSDLRAVFLGRVLDLSPRRTRLRRRIRTRVYALVRGLTGRAVVGRTMAKGKTRSGRQLADRRQGMVSPTYMREGRGARSPTSTTIYELEPAKAIDLNTNVPSDNPP